MSNKTKNVKRTKTNQRAAKRIRLIKFANDLFFKYMLRGNTKASICLLKTIIKLVTGINCKSIVVQNPEINGDVAYDKNIILDIRAIDEFGHEFDIEMQMYGSMDSESKRFQYYGAKMICDQLREGDTYFGLKNTFQIIFINDDPGGDLIEEYCIKNQHNEVIYKNINKMYLIHMKTIERILETKRIDELNDIERLCYLFIKNDYNDIIKDDKDDIIRQVVSMYNKFNNDEPMWSVANQRALARVQEKSIRMELTEKGKEIGKEIGKEEGKLEMCQQQIMKRYHEDAFDWLKTLTVKQLDMIAELIFDVDNFEELKAIINNS